MATYPGIPVPVERQPRMVAHTLAGVRIRRTALSGTRTSPWNAQNFSILLSLTTTSGPSTIS